VNIPASAQAEPPETQHDVWRFIWLGLLYGVVFLAVCAGIVRLLGLPVK
jgi:hypothetical protein